MFVSTRTNTNTDRLNALLLYLMRFKYLSNARYHVTRAIDNPSDTVDTHTFHYYIIPHFTTVLDFRDIRRRTIYDLMKCIILLLFIRIPLTTVIPYAADLQLQFTRQVISRYCNRHTFYYTCDVLCVFYFILFFFFFFMIHCVEFSYSYGVS
jgi:hypothetical protein